VVFEIIRRHPANLWRLLQKGYRRIAPTVQNAPDPTGGVIVIYDGPFIPIHLATANGAFSALICKH
jgi:hypothetical protein